MQTAKFQSELLSAVAVADDYRSFLKSVLVLTSRDRSRCNYAAFSRKAGFSSRSFIVQVLDGKRRLTSKSYPKIEHALPVPPKVKTYFRLLVAKEEPEVNFDRLSPSEIEDQLNVLRNKFKTEADGVENSNAALSSMFMGRELLECYAALGAKDVGASLEEIGHRTSLPLEVCTKMLRYLVEKTIVGEKDGRYFSQNPHLIFFGKGGEQAGIRDCYLQTLGELKRKAQAQFRSNDRAFFQSVFSVDRRRLPELKKRLWEVVNDFVEQHEAEEGDSIGKLLIGFYT